MYNIIGKQIFQIGFLTMLLTVLFPMYASAAYMEIEIGLNEKLSSKYTDEVGQLDSLKITGYFHTDDITFIRDNLSGMAASHSYHYFYKKGALSYLDLSDARFAGIYGGSMQAWEQLPENFGNGLAVSVLKLPQMEINRESFSDNPYLHSLVIAPNTKIGMYCFRNCHALESIFIPSGCVFSNTCFRGKNLKKFIVDSNNKLYQSVDGLLLDKDGKTLLAVPYGLKRVQVPNSVEIVNWAAIEWNQNIEVIQFGTNIKEFQTDPFNDNPQLDRIILQSTESIDLPKSGSQYYYFGGCDHFRRCGFLYVPKGTKQFYEGAPGWGEIPNIIEYLPEDLTSIYEKEIEDDSYGYEYDFKVGDIYYKVTSFEDNTVGVVNGYKPYNGFIDIPQEITYNNRKLYVTSIISMNNGDISKLVIPNSVKSIGGLSGNSFESINLPDNLSELRGAVFAHCENLNGIDIPESVKEIPASAFRGCYKLEHVNWRPQKGSANIGPYAFHDCFSLKSFTFTSNMWATGTISTSGLGYVSAFYYCTSLDSINFEDGSHIYFGYFYEGNGRDNDCGEFYGSNVKKIYLGSLYSNHFFSPGPYFSALEEVIIGDNIEIIKKERNYSTFPSLYGLKKLTLGTRLSEIETFSAEKIWVKNPNPPTINGELSNDVYLNSELFVPRGSIDAYKNAPIWKNFWNIYEFDVSSGVVEINYNTIKYPVGIYDINGRLHSEPVKGLNIIRYSDGTTEKRYY